VRLGYISYPKCVGLCVYYAGTTVYRWSFCCASGLTRICGGYTDGGKRECFG
jgi:hypothetical protein